MSLPHNNIILLMNFLPASIGLIWGCWLKGTLARPALRGRAGRNRRHLHPPNAWRLLSGREIRENQRLHCCWECPARSHSERQAHEAIHCIRIYMCVAFFSLFLAVVSLFSGGWNLKNIYRTAVYCAASLSNTTFQTLAAQVQYLCFSSGLHMSGWVGGWVDVCWAEELSLPETMEHRGVRSEACKCVRKVCVRCFCRLYFNDNAISSLWIAEPRWALRYTYVRQCAVATCNGQFL